MKKSANSPQLLIINYEIFRNYVIYDKFSAKLGISEKNSAKIP